MILKKPDLEWKEVETAFGAIDTPVFDGIPLEPIAQPSRHSVVYMVDHETQSLKPILIESGNYLVNGRVSNFWYWREINEDLSISNERKSGYGGFYKSPFEFNVEVQLVVTMPLKSKEEGAE